MHSSLVNLWNIRQNANWSVIVFLEQVRILYIGVASANKNFYKLSPLF